MMAWGRTDRPRLYKWLTARWMLGAGARYKVSVYEIS